jgi:AcrR family transcriptional regulator
VATGTDLFERQGYGRTTMDDIAEAAGITKRTLYRYVSTKQDFLLMIHEQFLDAAESLLQDQASTATEQFREFVKAYCTVIVQHQKAVRIFFEEEYHLTAEARAKVIARRDHFEDRLRHLLRAGQESGEFRKFDVAVISAGVFGALAGIYQWFTPRGPMSVDQLAETVSDLLIGGLSQPGRNASAPYPGLRLEVDELSAGKPPTPLPQRVVDAAVQLFATKGYTETNTREIAELAQVTKSALFYYIGSKEELLYTIQRDFAKSTLDELSGWLSEPADDYEDVLRRVVVNHAEVIGDRRHSVRIFADQLRYLEPGRRAEIERMRGRYVEGLVSLLSAGQDAGALRAYDTRVGALIGLGMLNWMSRWFDPAGRWGAAQIGEEYARVLGSGIQAAPE